MAEPLVPDVAVNICQKCVGEAASLPRQWKQAGTLVTVRELPCSGKVDVQYLLHALEGVRHGVCVVACPPGKCRLAQGNHRAQMRVETARRLLAEIGLQPERAQLLYYSSEQPRAQLEQAIRETVQQLAALGPSPLHSSARSSVSIPSRTTERGDDWGRLDTAQPT